MSVNALKDAHPRRAAKNGALRLASPGLGGD